MRISRTALFAFALIVGWIGSALAGSTINPNVPAQNSTLSSAVVRGNFAAAYNDVTNILGMFPGATAPGSPVVGQLWRKTSVTPQLVYQWTGSAWSQVSTFNVSTGAITPYFGSSLLAWQQLLTGAGGLGTSGQCVTSTGTGTVPTMQSCLSASTFIATLPLVFNSGTLTLSLNVGTGLSVSGSNLVLTAPVTVALGGTNCIVASGTCLDNVTGFSSTGFLTRTGAGTYAFQSTTNGITLANLVQGAANTMLGNWTGSTANVAANAMPSCPDSGGNHLNYVSGTGITCGTGLGNGITSLTTDVVAAGPGAAVATIQANVVTYAKFQQVAASSLVGNATAGLANATGITLGTTLAFSGAALQTGAGTGDVSWSSNSFATTLATVNSNVGSFGSSTAIPTFTVNGKGLITAASTAVVIAPAGTLTGTTLAATVVTSSLTSVGTLTGGTASTGFTIQGANVTWSGQIAGANVAVVANASGAPSATFGVMKADGTTIQCTSGTCSAVGGVATSIQVGVTTVTSGSPPALLANVAGVLQEYTVATAAQVAAGTATKMVDAAVAVSAALPSALSAGATVTPDLNAAISFTLTPNQNFTLANPSNITGKEGRSFCIAITNDSTPRTITWGTSYYGPGGSANLTLTASASALDNFCMFIVTTTKIFVVQAKNFSH